MKEEAISGPKSIGSETAISVIGSFYLKGNRDNVAYLNVKRIWQVILMLKGGLLSTADLSPLCKSPSEG